MEKRRISCPFQESNPSRPARSPSPCRLSYFRPTYFCFLYFPIIGIICILFFPFFHFPFCPLLISFSYSHELWSLLPVFSSVSTSVCEDKTPHSSAELTVIKHVVLLYSPTAFTFPLGSLKRVSLWTEEQLGGSVYSVL
jgi:hypothetical protein